ncbi:MAG: hypothetical protein A2V87_08025 [Deltaproteobacteria bacterium RBG_16_58_17]|nr:MAG: hypothetical protein A2V87_08025 [Deltaproteobacteria bacterium RBG_16_58_17]OHE20429.1 MAG: hypothetical protein A2X95_04210 [Syntrophobacterales bacterium GWF2_56_9]
MNAQNRLLHTLRLIAIKVRKARIKLSGRPVVDLSYKQQRLLEIGQHFKCDTFLETGTYLGDTVRVVKDYFDIVISVELSKELYQRNKERFSNCRNVMLWCGSSGNLMSDVLCHVGSGRILFWLDAHYSGEGTARGEQDCPLLSELAAIAGTDRHDHCILIDDALCFTHTPGYPTIGEIRKMLLNINPAFRITTENNCIAALPPL